MTRTSAGPTRRRPRKWRSRRCMPRTRRCGGPGGSPPRTTSSRRHHWGRPSCAGGGMGCGERKAGQRGQSVSRGGAPCTPCTPCEPAAVAAPLSRARATDLPLGVEALDTCARDWIRALGLSLALRAVLAPIDCRIAAGAARIGAGLAAASAVSQPVAAAAAGGARVGIRPTLGAALEAALQGPGAWAGGGLGEGCGLWACKVGRRRRAASTSTPPRPQRTSTHLPPFLSRP